MENQVSKIYTGDSTTFNNHMVDKNPLSNGSSFVSNQNMRAAGDNERIGLKTHNDNDMISDDEGNIMEEEEEKSTMERNDLR